MEKPKKNILALQKQYQQRITLAKHGQDAYVKGDLKSAISFYNQYLKVLADINDTDINHLAPMHFDKKTQSSEMFLLSQIYWDLAKLYDLSPSLRKEFLLSLSQFANFSLNTSFQIVNAETLRRFIRKGRCKNIDDFKKTYEQISIASKMCFIATHTFGDDHIVTHKLRVFKSSLLNQSRNAWIIERYYYFSPRLIKFLQNHKKFDEFSQKYLFRPLLTWFSHFF